MIERSLRELRRAVGQRSGDMLLLQASSPGTTTMLSDRNNLWLPDHVTKGRMALFMNGANAGEKRVVTAGTQATTSIEWGVPLLAPVAQGDAAELWRKRGQGYDPIADVNAAINHNIRIASEYTWTDAVVAIPSDFDIATGSVSIPGDVRVIAAVEYEDAAGHWAEIPLAGSIDAAGWSLNRGNRTIELNGPYAAMANRRALRLRVQQDLALLSTDTDTTTASFEWLVAQTCADLLGMSYSRQEEDRGLFNRWQAAMRDAEQKRPSMVLRLPPGSQTL